MALQGKIISLGPDKFGFEYHHTDPNKPEVCRQVWAVANCGTNGMSYCTTADAIGRDATMTDGHVSYYLGHGNYFRGYVGGNTPSISIEWSPVPAPRGKSEKRWHYGKWEKLTRKGWVAA